MEPRFKKIASLDYKKGAVEYPGRLDVSNRYHLYTKPFYNLANKISRWSGDGLDEDTQRHFIDFANMAYALALPAGARILDVGCGSGWLCEYFARLGYEMTGIDLSPDMIAIARERVSKIPYGADHETELRCHFLVHDVESAPLSQRFEAVLCYDALHHFEDENAVLANINTMIAPRGQLFVMEGETPPEGSETATELRSVMREYETLESPFEGKYLRQLLRSHSFAIVGDYLAFRGFVDRENVVGNTVQFIEASSVSYLLCRKVAESGESVTLPDTRNPGQLRADLSLRDKWTEEVVAGSRIETGIEVENTGDTLWLVSREPLTGTVRLGLKIVNSAGETLTESHGDPPLKHALAPGEKTSLLLNFRAPEAPGQYTLKLDLVNQNICWFEQHGSQPLLLSFDVIPRDDRT